MRFLDTNNQATNRFTELTPLLDVVFMLVIFLILSTDSKQLFSYSINFAQVQKQETVTQVNHLVIFMDPYGHLFTATDKQQPNESIEAFLQRTITPQTLNLELVADKTVPYQYIVQVLEQTNGLGVSAINLIVAQE